MAFADEWRGHVPAGHGGGAQRPARRGQARRAAPREPGPSSLAEFGIPGLGEAEIEQLNRAWHRLDPWPDAVPGLTRLKRSYILATLSNGNVALMVNMARRAGLPWDAILGAEVARAYKPQPEAYLGTADFLGLEPAECCWSPRTTAISRRRGARVPHRLRDAADRARPGPDHATFAPSRPGTWSRATSSTWPTSLAADPADPQWLDRAEYPFASRWLDLPAGRMHYVDEGQGRPLVFVHGTPDWSFGWRHLIKALRPPSAVSLPIAWASASQTSRGTFPTSRRPRPRIFAR